MLATFSVTSLGDAPVDTPAAIGTLRQAIAEANGTGVPDEIIFNLPSGQDTITLTEGELLVTDSVDIVGPGSGALAIQADNGHRIFHVNASASQLDFAFQGLTLTGGDVNDNGGAILFDLFNTNNFTLDLLDVVFEDNQAERGGALYANNDSGVNQINVANSWFHQNHADELGGAIVLDMPGTTTFSNTIISENSTSHFAAARGTGSPDLGSGGGVAIVSGSSTTIFSNTVIRDNTSTHNGGGIYAQNSGARKNVIIQSSSIYGNTAKFDGGGVYFCPKGGGVNGASELLISNTTIDSNRATFAGTSSVIASRGGGVFIGAEVRTTGRSLIDAEINNATITRNESVLGAGLYGYIGLLMDNGSGGSVDLEMHNSIVAENTDLNGQPTTDIDAEFVVPTSGPQDNQLFEPESSHNLVGTLGSAIPVTELSTAAPFNNQKGVNQAQLQLGQLGYYGGFSIDFYTVPFLTDGPTSVAIDAGNNAEAIDPQSGIDLDYDQRGGDGPTGDAIDYLRRYDTTGGGTAQDPIVDVGAYEYQPVVIDPENPDDPDQPPLPPGTQFLLVTTEDDEIDGNLKLDDISLREAVQFANQSSSPTFIILPAGRYSLYRDGTEADDASYNDLDITSNVTLRGDGAGLSVIDVALVDDPNSSDPRAFEILGAGASLDITGVTIANGSAFTEGHAFYVSAGGALSVADSAMVNHQIPGGGTAVHAVSATIAIERSVFTNNNNYYPSGAAVLVYGTAQAPSSLTIGSSIFALNRQNGIHIYAPTTKGVEVSGTVTKTNLGRNLYDDASGGFFDATPGTDDHQGSVDYVVTSVVDTYDQTDNLEALSIREAIHLANEASGHDEIWLPAWDFILTRDRGTNATDTDVAYGDLDIHDQLTIRGVKNRTSVAWKAGIVDSVFDLIGDYNNNGAADQDVTSADFGVWASQNGSGSGTSADWEAYAADGDDDGDVDLADRDLMTAYYGNSLDLFNVE